MAPAKEGQRLRNSTFEMMTLELSDVMMFLVPRRSWEEGRVLTVVCKNLSRMTTAKLATCTTEIYV